MTIHFIIILSISILAFYIGYLIGKKINRKRPQAVPRFKEDKQWKLHY